MEVRVATEWHEAVRGGAAEIHADLLRGHRHDQAGGHKRLAAHPAIYDQVAQNARVAIDGQLSEMADAFARGRYRRGRRQHGAGGSRSGQLPDLRKRDAEAELIRVRVGHEIERGEVRRAEEQAQPDGNVRNHALLGVGDDRGELAVGAVARLGCGIKAEFKDFSEFVGG